MSGEQIERVRGIAAGLGMRVALSAPDSALGAEATAGSELRIEIHPDIRSHIQSYIAASDYFHAVEEAYKVVREKLRELTGEERATAIFNENALNERHYPKFFGDDPSPTQAERDFRRGVGYLHLGVQFLRNEKAHTLATDMEPNLAIHYVALASLAYDLVTRHVGEATVKEIEDLVVAKRRGYRSATAFYREFENGRWISSLVLPDCFKSVAVRKRLKAKWVEEADFTRSFDQSNIALMQLELVAGELTDDELDELMARPTKDSYGNDQQAGMVDFLEYVSSTRPGGLTATAKARLAALTVESSS
ncbi:TIGR02391 family protein [Tessaracoccus flavescens]|nr:TIGR02391 family protein [Tessaracoccus flavescens]